MLSRFATKNFIARNTARMFSVAIDSVPEHRPPVVEETVEGRYAGVLFTLASRAEQLSVIQQDMEMLSQLIKQSDAFRGFLVNTSTKKAEFQQVFEQINGSFDELTVNFLDAVIENKKVDDLETIVERFLTYYKMLNKEEAVTIVSAQELTDQQQQ